MAQQYHGNRTMVGIGQYIGEMWRLLRSAASHTAKRHRQACSAAMHTKFQKPILSIEENYEDNYTEVVERGVHGG